MWRTQPAWETLGCVPPKSLFLSSSLKTITWKHLIQPEYIKLNFTKSIVYKVRNTAYWYIGQNTLANDSSQLVLVCSNTLASNLMYMNEMKECLKVL